MSQAQMEDLTLCQIYQGDVKERTLDLHNQYIKANLPKDDWKMLSNLYSSRARLRLGINNINRKANNSLWSNALTESKSDLDRAIRIVKDENLMIEYIFRRYVVMEKYGKYNEIESDYAALKSAGYKKDRDGIGVFLKSKYDGDFWLGLEGAVFSGTGGRYKLVNGYGEVFTKGRDISATALSLSYLRNLNRKWSEWSFSILKLEAPIYIDIIQFGQLYTADESYFFYRPEVGVGYGPITLSYGFNVFFKKGVEDGVQRHMVNLRGRYVFDRKKKLPRLY